MENAEAEAAQLLQELLDALTGLRHKVESFSETLETHGLLGPETDEEDDEFAWEDIDHDDSSV